MRLRTKVILVCSLATASISAVSGSVAIIATSNAAVAKIDTNLNILVNSACTSKDPIGSSLLLLDTIGADTEVGFFSINGDYSTLSDAAQVIAQPPSVRQLRAASNSIRTIAEPGGSSFRLKTCRLPDNEYVVFATSLEEANRTTGQNILLWSSMMVFAILAGALLIWLLTRKDLARIEQLIGKAEDISSGNFEVELEKVTQKSELDILNNSLSQMVESLKKALSDETQAKRLSKDFLADASHELRTPLTMIRGYFELLTRDDLDQATADRSRSRIQEQILRMQSLITDMLLLSELEQKPQLQSESVDFSRIVKGSVEDLKALHPKRNVEVNVEPNLCVAGSAKLLEQLISNIVSNISRHTGEQDAVEVCLQSDGEFIVLTIDDAGPGLPDRAYENGISHFTRFDESRSRTTGGSGLGISIMKAIVLQHGGQMQLQRSAMGGLCTRIELPRLSQIS